MCIRDRSGTAEAHRQIEQNVRPTHLAIVSDSVTQKSLNSVDKINMELWTNGFIGNSAVNVPGRLLRGPRFRERIDVLWWL